MTAQSPPDGYAPHFRKSGFTDPWEPLYSKASDREVSLGVWLRDAHCNSRGFAHGGLITSLADNAMGLSCVAVLKAEGRDVSGLVTINLATDFIGSGQIGEWLQTETGFVKTTGSLCFVNCLLSADGRHIARASASFKIIKPKD